MMNICKIVLTAMLLAAVFPFYDLFTGNAYAGEMELICKSPRRAYQVVFDDKAKTFKLMTAGNVTNYSVTRVNNTAKGLVITGKTVKNGPDFAAHFGTNPRLEFIIDGSIAQTDHCKLQ